MSFQSSTNGHLKATALHSCVVHTVCSKHWWISWRTPAGKVHALVCFDILVPFRSILWHTHTKSIALLHVTVNLYQQPNCGLLSIYNSWRRSFSCASPVTHPRRHSISNTKQFHWFSPTVNYFSDQRAVGNLVSVLRILWVPIGTRFTLLYRVWARS